MEAEGTVGSKLLCSVVSCQCREQGTLVFARGGNTGGDGKNQDPSLLSG